MGCVSPSPFTSLKVLEQIKADHYRSKDGETEYCPEEVDFMINEKRAKKAEESVYQMHAERKEAKRQAETLDPMTAVRTCLEEKRALDAAYSDIVDEVQALALTQDLPARLMRALIRIQMQQIKTLKQTPF